MHTAGDSTSNEGTTLAAPRAERVDWGRFLIWLAAGLAFAVAIAWLTVAIEPRFAPFLLLPLLVGATVGLGAVLGVRVVEMGHRPAGLIGVVLMVLVAVIARHWVSYQRWDAQSRKQAEAFAEAQLALAGKVELDYPNRPESFVAFLQYQARNGRPWLGGRPAQGVWAWLSWGLDALVMLGGALAVSWFVLQQPFCPHCRTWYRTLQSGEAERSDADKLLQLLGSEDRGVAIGEEVRYRLQRCRAGCDPAGLELSWSVRPTRGSPRRRVQRVWLAGDERRRLIEQLESYASRPKLGVRSDA